MVLKQLMWKRKKMLLQLLLPLLLQQQPLPLTLRSNILSHTKTAVRRGFFILIA
jgi:hypothetical protein